MRPILRYWLLYSALLYASIAANYVLGLAAPGVSSITTHVLMERIPSGAGAAAIFLYNSKVVLMSLAVVGMVVAARRSRGWLGRLFRGLASAGLAGTLVAVILVGFLIGMVLSSPEINRAALVRCGTRSVLFAGIFTHGWLELSAVALLFSVPAAYARGEGRRVVLVATLSGVAMLLGAALIEAYLTPRVASVLCPGAIQ